MSESCSHACGGRCCSDFVISSHSPERIGELYAHAVASIIAGEASYSSPWWQNVKVSEMVIRIDEDDEARPRYTCKHFLPDVGLCGDYENRPSMCSRFPYGHVCDYGCGYKNELPSLEPELVQITTTTETTDPSTHQEAA